MKKDTELTKVKFLVDDTGEIFALFPDQVYAQDPAVVTSYAHIGQHFACALSYASECKEALQMRIFLLQPLMAKKLLKNSLMN